MTFTTAGPVLFMSAVKSGKRTCCGWETVAPDPADGWAAAGALASACACAWGFAVWAAAVPFSPGRSHAESAIPTQASSAKCLVVSMASLGEVDCRADRKPRNLHAESKGP